MATIREPRTGVFINCIDKWRNRLSPLEQETARLLRDDGLPIHRIAALLGTHSYVISRAVREARVSTGQFSLF